MARKGHNLYFAKQIGLALFALADLGLGGGEAGDGHAERAAGHVVNANGVEEEDGLGVTTVLTADTAGEAGALAAALVHTNLHQLANGLLVDGYRHG